MKRNPFGGFETVSQFELILSCAEGVKITAQLCRTAVPLGGRPVD